MQDDDEIIHYLTNNGIKLRSRVAFYAWKSDDKEVVLATLPKSIVGDILNVCNGSAPNLPSGGHVLSISKVGYGITTKYAVTAEPLLMREQEINMLLEDLPSMTEVLNLKDLDEVKQLLP